MAAQDITQGGLGQPIGLVFPIVPNDNTDVQYMTRGIYIGTGGTLTVMTVGGTIGVFTNLNSGTILPVRATRVYATGTTATGLLNLL